MQAQQRQQETITINNQINSSVDCGDQVILKMNDIPQLSSVGKLIGHFILTGINVRNIPFRIIRISTPRISSW